MLDRSPLVRCCRWLSTWHGIRRVLIVLAWTATIIALFYAEENWRGRHLWNKYRHELEAQGEQLEFSTFIPKPVPDDQNFAATPFVKSWFERTASGEFKDPFPDNYSRANDLVSAPRGETARRRRHFEDLVAWEMAFAAVRSAKAEPNRQFEPQDRDLEQRAKAAPAVLENLKVDEPIFAELLAVSSRPQAVYPVKYDVDNPWAILLPHLTRVKGTCQRLELKACAELALGQSDAAFGDVQQMLGLADSLRQEPILISYLVRLADWQIATRVVWEGLAEHRWTDAQVQALTARLLQADFLADVQMPLRTERAAAVFTIDYVKRLGSFGQFGSPGDVLASDLMDLLCRSVVPRGWFEQEKLTYCRIAQMYVRSGFNPAEKRLVPGQIQANAQDVLRVLHDPSRGPIGRLLNHQVAAAMLLPSIDGVLRKTAMGQTVVNQAALACALERYRLANGQLPEHLEALAPQFTPHLPHDVLSGRAYKYRRTDDGQFVLYSVGWNEKDDGGVPGKTLFDDKQGDWVWDYPAK